MRRGGEDRRTNDVPIKMHNYNFFKIFVPSQLIAVAMEIVSTSKCDTLISCLFRMRTNIRCGSY